MDTDRNNKPQRRWCFTINNPNEMHVVKEGTDGVRYAIWQYEEGEENHTPHLQGYIEFTTPWRMARVKALIGNDAHVEAAKYPEAANTAYCSKEPRLGGPWIVGNTSSSGQGKRTDLKPYEEEAIAVAAGKPLCDVPPGIFVKHASGFTKLAALTKPKMRPNFKVICMIAGPNIGKSTWAYNHYPDLYKPYYGNGGMWWDGYCGQKTVFLDEFRGHCTLSKGLHYLDKMPLMLETKGGSVAAQFDLLIIASNSAPEDWYPEAMAKHPQDFQALLRRLGRLPILFPYQNSYYIMAGDRRTLIKECNAAVRAPLKQDPYVDDPSEDEAGPPVPLVAATVPYVPVPPPDTPKIWDDEEITATPPPPPQHPIVIDLGNDDTSTWYTANMCDGFP